MSDPRVSTAARAAAVVLGCLCVYAGLSAGYVVWYAVAERSAPAGVGAVASAAVTGALGWGATRMWRR